MTSDTTFVLAGHARPELIPFKCPPKQRGRREGRVPNAPAAPCALSSFSVRTSIHSGSTGIIRPSLRSGLGYGALPATNSSCHRRLADGRLIRARLGRWPRRDLTPATGARTTRFNRPRQCRSSCTPLLITHELPRPATSCAHDTIASTASRAQRS